jgi:hypothetical protein
MAHLSRLVLAVALLLVTAQLRAEPLEAVDSFLGIRLGTPLAEALAAQPAARILQQTKTELDGCYFQYAIPTTLAALPAEARLCERRGDPDQTIAAFSIELWTDQAGYLRLVEAVAGRYGQAHLIWGACHNSAGHATEQFSWYLGAAVVRLINRDVFAGWIVLRIDGPGLRADYGPGVCRSPPVELRPRGEPGDG